MSSTIKGSAEQDFRAAFARLKKRESTILPPGSSVTQNNVAREAGRDPSALKKARYPLLILEIQAYTSLNSESIRNSKRTTDNRVRTEKQKLADYRRQIDKLSSIVAAQNSTIEELLDEINQIKSGKVSSFSVLHSEV